MRNLDSSLDTSPDGLVEQIKSGLKPVKSRAIPGILPSTIKQPQQMRRKPWNDVSSVCTTPSSLSECSDDDLSSFSGSPTSKPASPTGGYPSTTKPAIPNRFYRSTSRPATPTGGYPTTTKPATPNAGYRSTSRPATPTGRACSRQSMHTSAPWHRVPNAENVPSRRHVSTTNDKTQTSPESKMKLSMLQGVWTYTSAVTKASVKVMIEGDMATWPEGRTAKITCRAKDFLLQFEGESDKYSAQWRQEDGALCWSDNAVWTRVGTPLKFAKFEDVIH